jgi:hypothetical protein
MLAIQKYLKENGLEKTVADFKLIMRHYGHKVLLKYNQIESDFSKEEVRDCRGLILENNTWNVMSLAFRKFFNAEEGHAAKIDWFTAKILEKIDGSLIQVYWDWVVEKWCVGTTGTAEGEGDVNGGSRTFADLFWMAAGLSAKEGIDYFSAKLAKGACYVFELTTPFNIVVVPHSVSSITLLTVRKMSDLTEFDYMTTKCLGEQFLYVPVVKAFDLNVKDVATLKKTFDGMPFSEEGYVVVDANFNRVKVKNPAYVAAHHLKSSLAEYKIMAIVKTNEVDEFIASFPERRDEILKLKASYFSLKTKLEATWEILKLRKPKNITKEESKRYATEVFKVCDEQGVKGFTGLYFSLKDGKVSSVNDYLLDYNEKHLYEMCSK